MRTQHGIAQNVIDLIPVFRQKELLLPCSSMEDPAILAARAIELSNQALQLSPASLVAGLEAETLFHDNDRITDTINFLCRTGKGQTFYINGKPPTVGCEEAAVFRFNPDEAATYFGPRDREYENRQLRHEIKSLVYQKDGEIYYFLMPGHQEVVDWATEGMNLYPNAIPYTLNPATFLSSIEPGGKINLVVSPNFSDKEVSGYYFNNVGSRLLSCSISDEHFKSMMAELSEEVLRRNGEIKEWNCFQKEGYSSSIDYLRGDHGRSLYRPDPRLDTSGRAYERISGVKDYVTYRY